MSNTKSDVTDTRTTPYPTDLYAPGAIEALIEFHRTQFGDARMEEVETEEEQPNESDAEGQEPEGNDEDGNESDESNEDGEDEGGDELPEQVREKIKKANREAEGLRKRLRDLEERLTGAKTPEEVASVTAELTQTNESLTLDLARERALRKHGLEEDDLVLLTASSPEDIDKQAERIASRIGGGGSGSLRGGLDPTDDDDEPSDPGELAKKYGRRRY